MSDSNSSVSEDSELRAHVAEALAAVYELEQEMGRGGMGIVYRARDKRLKRTVAIKLLPPELAFRRDVRSRFLREAETAAQLSHPNIVPIYSVDEVGNLVYFVMACIEGDNLSRKVQQRGPLPIEDVRRWMQEVGDALAYAHARGVVHRDIKPDNILLDAIDGRALVTDFGIARAAGDGSDASRLTATGAAIGTPAYMSPEQASGDRDLDARSDLYSLGIVAYQTLCGEPPFTGTATPALLVKHLAEAPVPIDQRRPDVPADLAAIVMRLLEKQPEHRFQSAAEVVQAIRTGIVPPTPRTATSAVSVKGAPIGGMPMGGMPLPNASVPYQAPAYSPRTQPVTPVSVPAGANRMANETRGGDEEHYVPTSADLARWEAPLVARFRRKLAFYLIVNIPLLIVSFFGRNGLSGVTTIWTVILAWQYAKLWSAGFDWRDALRQPRHRMFGEVLSDLWENLEATFSAKKRERLRAQGRLRSRISGALSPSSPFPLVPSVAGAGSVASSARTTDADFGAHAAPVAGARQERDEIVRLLETLPADERARLPELQASAAQLVRSIEALAVDLAAGDATMPADQAARVEAEITALEADANPMDTVGSEVRVRRLAQLRRERRAVQEMRERQERRLAQLASCQLALGSMRLDLVRLRTGGSTVQGLTEIAAQAVALARDVDIAVQAASDVRALTTPRR